MGDADNAKYAIVCANFSAAYDDEISLEFNDIVKIKSDYIDGWCFIEFNGKVGKAPFAVLNQIDYKFIGLKGKALADFKYNIIDKKNHFISFFEHDSVTVISRSSDGWNKAICNGHIGYYPEGLVDLGENLPLTEFKNIITCKINDDLPYIGSLFKMIDKLESSSVLADDIAWPLIQIFRNSGNFFDFFDTIVKVEMNECPEESVLFRKNSWVSKLFTQYSRSVCNDYLKNKVKPLIEYIINSETPLEVDQQKIGINENVESNQENLLKVSLYFLESLLDSINALPDGLRYCFNIITNQVALVFPTAIGKAVGGFFFLRMICPIIAGGDLSAVGLEDIKIEPTARRGLILITKILQNLANEVQFGAKESFMIPLNDKMEVHRQICGEILEKIPLRLDSPPIEALDSNLELEVKQTLKRLHGWMAKENIMPYLYNKMKKGILTEENIIHFRETILKCGPTLPDSALFFNTRIHQSSNLTHDVIKKPSKSSVFPSLRNKKTKKIKEEKYFEIPCGKLQCASYLKGKQINSGQKSAKLRYYAIYSSSSKIYSFPTFDDVPKNVCGIIDLAPTFSVKPIQRTKQTSSWEFRLRTIKEEYIFTTTEENVFRKWILTLDKILNESVMSEEDKNEKQELIRSLEEKLQSYILDLTETKKKLKQSYDNPSEEDAKHLEELMISIQNLKNTITMVNS